MPIGKEKSRESALDQITIQTEDLPNNQEIALRIFLYIEGAFENIPFEAMFTSLKQRGTDKNLLLMDNINVKNR